MNHHNDFTNLATFPWHYNPYCEARMNVVTNEIQVPKRYSIYDGEKENVVTLWLDVNKPNTWKN